MENDLSIEVRAHEIHEKATSYYRTSEQFGYKFLMELKVIRDEKLFRELGFNNFEEYTLSNFGYSRNTSNERIQAAEFWGEDYNRALGSYGRTKTRQVAQLPEKEREEAINNGIPTENGQKNIDEATTREIENYQKRLKKSEEEKEQMESQLKQKDEQIEQLDEAIKNQEPEVVEVEKVVEKNITPPDYDSLKSDNKQLSSKLKQTQKEAEENRKRNEFIEQQYQEVLNDRKDDLQRKERLESMESELKRLANKRDRLSDNIETIKELSNLNVEVNELLERIAPYYFNHNINAIRDDSTLEQSFMETVDSVQKWCDEMYKLLGKQNTIEGEIIND